VDFSEITPPEELLDPIHVESFLDLAPIPPITPLSSSLPIFVSSLNPPESTFIESETFVLRSPCLDQILDDNDIERLEDDFEVKDLILGNL